MTTRSTSASAASALRSGVSPANRAATALERTTSEPMPDSDVAIASGRLNARKSVSGIGPQHAERQHHQTRERAGPRPACRRRVAEADAAQLVGHRRRPTPAGRGPLGQRPANHAIDRGDGRRPGERRRLLVQVACRISTTVRPANAGRPASISNRMAPAANRSLRASTGSPRDLLGRHVARRADHACRCASVAARRRSSSFELGRARPKSSSFTPCGVRNTLDGLRSRWTMPRACSAAERGEHAESDRHRLGTRSAGPAAAARPATRPRAAPWR